MTSPQTPTTIRGNASKSRRSTLPTRAQLRADAWAKVVALEPRLWKLYAEALGHRQRCRQLTRVCANSLWYGWYDNRWRRVFTGGLDAQVHKLVGWGRPKRDGDDPWLYTSEAFDAACRYLYRDVLPDCRNCGEVTMAEIGRLLHRG